MCLGGSRAAQSRPLPVLTWDFRFGKRTVREPDELHANANPTSGSSSRLVLVTCLEYDLVVSGKGGALLQAHRQVDGIEPTQPMLQYQAVGHG